MIERHELQKVPPAVEYVLSARGRRLTPILDAMEAWGAEGAGTAGE